MPPVPQLKKQLRQHFRGLRRELSPRLRSQQARAVVRHLIGHLSAHPEIQRIAAYRALPEELNLDPLVRSFHDRTWFFPRVEGRHLAFVATSDLDHGFATGCFGVLEPVGPTASTDDLDLVLMPALAVDPSGARLGYGGGFYDRFLTTHPHVRTLAVLFSLSRVDDPLPFVPQHDRRVDGWVTPTGIHRAAAIFTSEGAPHEHLSHPESGGLKP